MTENHSQVNSLKKCAAYKNAYTIHQVINTRNYGFFEPFATQFIYLSEMHFLQKLLCIYIIKKPSFWLVSAGLWSEFAPEILRLPWY